MMMMVFMVCCMRILELIDGKQNLADISSSNNHHNYLNRSKKKSFYSNFPKKVNIILHYQHYNYTSFITTST